MLTNTFAHRTRSSSKHQSRDKEDTSRQNTNMLVLQHSPFKNQQLCQLLPTKKDRQPFLPSISRTQHLLPYRKKPKLSLHDYLQDRSTHRPLTKLRKLVHRQGTHQNQNQLTRALTDERQNIDQDQAYHNFVKRNRDRRVNHMSNIIKKVLSEGIQPWNAQNDYLGKKEAQFGQKNMKHMRHRIAENAWQKYVLSDYNFGC